MTHSGKKTHSGKMSSFLIQSEAADRIFAGMVREAASRGLVYNPQLENFESAQPEEDKSMTDTAEKTEKKTGETVVNRHWNDDGSLTLYADGLKIRRLGGEENEEASEDEIEDPEGVAEKWLNRKYKKAQGGWRWGRTTHGHNWHTKKAKAERLRAEREAAELAQKETEL